jgi:hypothetical protein
LYIVDVLMYLPLQNLCISASGRNDKAVNIYCIRE